MNTSIFPYKFQTNNWSKERYNSGELLKGKNPSNQQFGCIIATEQVNEVLRYTRDRRNAIDCGARFGNFTVPLHKAGFNHVYMIEIMEQFMEPISLNVDLNRATVYNFPVFSHTTDVWASGKRISETNNGGVLTKTHSIDDLELEDIDFIKIDCDGPDRLILEGAIQTIERYRPVIHIEFDNGQLRWDKNVKEPDDMWKILRDKNLNYRMQIAEEDRHPTHCNLLLIPNE